jgi:hypothetical protein
MKIHYLKEKVNEKDAHKIKILAQRITWAAEGWWNCGGCNQDDLMEVASAIYDIEKLIYAAPKKKRRKRV